MVKDLVDSFLGRYGRMPTERDPDYLEMLRMSKYRILDMPQVSPSKCANCGSSKIDSRKYIDFDLLVDWYGVVYICTICLFDIAKQSGLFLQFEEKISDLEKTILGIRENEFATKKLQASLLKTIEEVRDYFVGLYPVGDDSSPGGTSSVESSDKSVESTSTSHEQNANSAEQRTAKSTSGSRSKNVRSLAELLDT